MNAYVCYYNGKSVHIKAESLYDGKKKAVEHFKAGKRHHMVTVILIEKDGQKVHIDPSQI